MKKIATILLALLAFVSVSAQSLYIYKGSVITVVNSSTAGEMTYTPTTLTANGVTFNLDEIDSIVVRDGEIRTDSVIITYSGTTAQVLMPVQVAKHATATIKGAHVAIESTQTDSTETIYALSGNSSNGSFYQKGVYKCTLRLNGLTLNNPDSAAINFQNGKRIDICVTDGTINTLSDNGEGGDQKACLRIKGHAEFKDAGTLNIAAHAAHAFKSGEYTRIRKSFGTLNITSAVKDGMHVGQYFLMNGGKINISGASGDGIQVEATTNQLDSLNGQMHIKGGDIDITLDGDDMDGLKTDALLSVLGGTINVTMNGNGAKAINAYCADVTDSISSPVFNLTVNGDMLTVVENGISNNKRPICFKTEEDMYFHFGTINAFTRNTSDAKGMKIGNNYYYTRKAVYKLNGKTATPDVTGAMYLRSK